MSREGALCRAREHARELEQVLGHGAVVELLGVRLVVLFAEPVTREARHHALAARPAANAPTAAPPA